MIALWMAYGSAVAALLGAAALLLEGVVARWALPVRWVWAGALAGSVLVPATVRMLPAPSAEAGSATLGEIAFFAGAAPASGAADPTVHAGLDLLRGLDAGLMALWIGASVGVLVYWLASLLALRRQARTWREATIDGRVVRLSDDLGPAVLGVFRPRIVVPGWVADAPAAERALVLAHEEEHLRAGDPRLLLLSSLLLFLLPWNLPLWWQLHRLRLAVELDCDARVVGRGADLHRYGALLLEVGGRRSAARFGAMALCEATSSLERRIRMLTRARPRSRWIPSLLGATLAAVLVLAACSVDQPPTAPKPDGALVGAPATAAPPSRAPVAAPGEPTFTPFDVQPELTNRDELRGIMHAHYPAALRDAGIGGQVVVWIFVDQTGAVQQTRVHTGSGSAELDSAAVAAARELRFSPAQNRGEPVSVWISVPISFSSGAQPAGAPSESGAEPARARVARTVAAPAERAPSAPAFTSFDTKPELKNPYVVIDRIRELYPADLRNAGVGGTVLVWVRVDQQGDVRETRLS